MRSYNYTESDFGPQSYYLDSVCAPTVHPQAKGPMQCDVCIVGGGFTGLSAALNLAEAGYDVVLLEAERIGWGASGRNGGQVINGYSKDLYQISRLLGPEHARSLWELSLEATQLLRDRIARHRIDAEYRQGYLLAAAKPRHLTGLAAERDCMERRGYSRTRLLDQTELQAHVRSDHYSGGLLDEGGGHLHPLKYARGLAAAATAAGVRIFEKSRVIHIQPACPDGSGKARASTEHSEISARHLVLGCNAYLGELDPELRARIMPVGTYIISTEPLGRDLALSLLPGNACVSDTNFVLDYYRLSADWRMLFGGRVSYTTLPPVALVNRMRQRLVAVFPQLQNVAITHAWGGFVDISRNRLPDIGRKPGNVYYAQGFSGHGVALTGLAGKVIADAIRGDAEKFDVFARIPHRSFPGGRFLRMPLLMLATLYSRLQDII